MLVLDDARIRRFTVRIVDDRNALIIRCIQNFGLKAQASVLKLTAFIIKIRINRTCINDFFRKRIIRCTIRKIIHISAHFNAIEQLINNLIIAVYWDALIRIVKIVIVIRIAHRETLDDECRQLRARSAPLLFRIALDELSVNIRADKANRLLFEVFGFACYDAALCFNLFTCFVRCYNTPKLRERIHIERHVVDFAFIICDW